MEPGFFFARSEALRRLLTRLLPNIRAFWVPLPLQRSPEQARADITSGMCGRVIQAQDRSASPSCFWMSTFGRIEHLRGQTLALPRRGGAQGRSTPSFDPMAEWWAVLGSNQ
jgi:hypothetical protein